MLHHIRNLEIGSVYEDDQTGQHHVMPSYVGQVIDVAHVDHDAVGQGQEHDGDRVKFHLSAGTSYWLHMPTPDASPDGHLRDDWDVYTSGDLGLHGDYHHLNVDGTPLWVEESQLFPVGYATGQGMCCMGSSCGGGGSGQLGSMLGNLAMQGAQLGMKAATQSQGSGAAPAKPMYRPKGTMQCKHPDGPGTQNVLLKGATVSLTGRWHMGRFFMDAQQATADGTAYAALETMSWDLVTKYTGMKDKAAAARAQAARSAPPGTNIGQQAAQMGMQAGMQLLQQGMSSLGSGGGSCGGGGGACFTGQGTIGQDLGLCAQLARATQQARSTSTHRGGTTRPARGKTTPARGQTTSTGTSRYQPSARQLGQTTPTNQRTRSTNTLSARERGVVDPSTQPGGRWRCESTAASAPGRHGPVPAASLSASLIPASRISATGVPGPESGRLPAARPRRRLLPAR
jgi:hypothetical protein